MAEPERHSSIEEYLAFERESEIKHEYLDGEIFAMSGASRKHNRISWNIAEALGPQLRESDCEGFVSDMRVHIPATGLFTYPDVTVVCGELDFHDDQTTDTLLNPTLIAEVLSPSTEDYDRGRKFAHYRSIPSLQLYLLVAQDHAHVERFERQPSGLWVLYETDDVGDRVELQAIGASLALADVYYRVPGIATQDAG
ncbi:MAG: Uma2 family endonuclease [bacterium]|nr:Uma2 family endonuclease [bacterium]